MHWFVVLLVVVLIILILGIGYLYTRIRTLFLLGKKKEDVPEKTRKRAGLCSAAVIAILFTLCAIRPYIMLVPVLHLIVIWAVLELLTDLVNRILKKNDAKVPFWVTGWLAICITVVYMLFCYYTAVHVCKTEYTVKTNKDVPTLRIALIADSHIGTCFDGEGFADHIKTIGEQHPDVLLICGDFVDDDTKKSDMIRSCQALGEIETTYGVFYVPGNHDAGYVNGRGFSYEDLLSELRENGVEVLEDSCAVIAGKYCIVGRNDRSMERREISSFKSYIDPEWYTIVLDHQPNDYDAEAAAGCDLVLSGHTHGGQMFPIGPISELLGANDATYGMRVIDGTTFIVTSGIADWALPYKSGTISEYCIIEIQPE